MKLLIKEGPNSGQELDLEGSSVLGRDPASASIVIEDPEASRRHASLAPGEGGVVVEDLGSTNGTFVNGERVEGQRTAAVGDEIRVGNTVLVVQSDVEVTRMSAIPEPADPGATAMADSPSGPPAADVPTGDTPAFEPGAADAPGFPPAAPQAEPGAAEPPPAPEPAAPMGGPPPFEPASTPPPAPEPPVAPPPPPAPGPPPPGGAGQGYGAPPQQAYQPGPPPMGQPGGAMAPAGYAPAGGIKTHESVVEWLLCIFVPFYSLYWIHRQSKEMQEWSGGRIDYSAGATIAALTIGSFVLIPPFVAIFSFGGRLRRAQELGGVQPRASGIGFFGRLLLLGYGYKWAQDQFNELAVRPPQA